jgi:uncharacterized ion transporter superfamily protein YfcC
MGAISQVPDLQTEYERRLYELEFQKTRLEELKQTVRQRRSYARLVFFVTLVWMVFVGVVVWQCARMDSRFHLSDAVLVALISGSTVNIIGLLVIVLKFIFNVTHRESDT